MPESTGERIEPGAEAAHRDDLARDVAQLWAVPGPWKPDVEALRNTWPQLAQRLDRLTSAYASRVDHRPRKRSACCDDALDGHGHCMYCEA